jgi:hypothetical protein
MDILKVNILKDEKGSTAESQKGTLICIGSLILLVIIIGFLFFPAGTIFILGIVVVLVVIFAGCFGSKK